MSKTKVKVRWTATFETEMEVDNPNDCQELIEAAADISLDGIPNTKYQLDTWQYEGFYMADDENNERELPFTS